jgi:hypothetical protein
VTWKPAKVSEWVRSRDRVFRRRCLILYGKCANEACRRPTSSTSTTDECNAARDDHVHDDLSNCVHGPLCQGKGAP